MVSKNILITGGARGIGRATARHLLSLPNKHRVYLLDLDEDELKYCAGTHLAAYHPRVTYSTINLRDAKAIRQVVKKAAEWFDNRIDVLLNNAGIARPYWTAGDGTMESEETAEQWNAYIETNLTAPFLVSQACIPYMKAQAASRKTQSVEALHGEDHLDEGACIINISSFRAWFSDPNCEGYAATKAGVVGLTHGIAVSGQRWGIRCNVISPGWVSVKHECREGDEKAADKLHEKLAPHEEAAERARNEVWQGRHDEEDHSSQPAGRVGVGKDIATTVEFVMNNGFLNGAEIVVDGGGRVKKMVP